MLASSMFFLIFPVPWLMPPNCHNIWSLSSIYSVHHFCLRSSGRSHRPPFSAYEVQVWFSMLKLNNLAFHITVQPLLRCSSWLTLFWSGLFSPAKMYYGVQCFLYVFCILLGAAFPTTLLQQPFGRFVYLQLKKWSKLWVFSHTVQKKTLIYRHIILQSIDHENKKSCMLLLDSSKFRFKMKILLLFLTSNVSLRPFIMLVILEALVQQGESKNCYSNAEDYNIIIVLSLGFCNLHYTTYQYYSFTFLIKNVRASKIIVLYFCPLPKWFWAFNDFFQGGIYHKNSCISHTGR